MDGLSKWSQIFPFILRLFDKLTAHSSGRTEKP